MGRGYRSMEVQKPWLGLELKRDFAKERRFKPYVKKGHMSHLGDVSKLM